MKKFFCKFINVLEINFSKISFIYIFILCLSSSFCLTQLNAQTLCDQYGNSAVDEILSGNYTTMVNRNNKVLQLNGTVYFSAGCYLIGCKIIAPSGTKIVLKNDAVTCPGCPPVPLITYKFLNTKLFSCNGLWEGLDAMANTVIHFNNNCEIENAKNAINARQGSKLYLRNSSFYDNLVGINVIGNVDVLFMKGNLFTSRSDFAELNSSTFIGINIVGNTNFFNIGAPANGTLYNTFSKLNVGVKCTNSMVEISNSRFLNNIKGIYAESTQKKLRDLRINGLKDLALTFENNVKNDVEIYKPYNLTILNCKSYRNPEASIFSAKSWFGVSVSEAENSNIEISRCAWQTEYLVPGFTGIPGVEGPQKIACIIMNGCTNITGFISNCEMKDNGSETSTHPIWFEKVIANGYYQISNNVIFAEDTKEYSCSFINSKNITINGFDKIERSGTPYPAVFVLGGENIQVNNNIIHDIYDTEIQPSGIRLVGVKNAVLCNNTLESDYRGIEVEGTCIGLKVSTNTFVDNKYGLYYQNKTLTNTVNEHTMNNWTGSNYILMANHDGTTFASNRFIVRQDNYGTSFPIYNPPSIMKNPSDDSWFKSVEMGEPNYCSTPSFNPNLDDRITGLIPIGDYNYRSLLGDDLIWDADKDLYKFIADNPGVHMPMTLENLYNNLLNSNIPSFVNTTSLIDNILKPMTPLQTNLNQLNFDVALLLSKMENFDNVISGMNIDTGQEDEYLERQQLSLDLEAKLAIRDFVIEEMEDEYIADLGIAISANNSLQPNTSQQVEEKLLNSLYLENLSGVNLSPVEISTIQNLANRCLGTYGNLVLYAQSLLPSSINFYRAPLMFCNPSQGTKLDSRSGKKLEFNDDKVYHTIEIYTLDGKLKNTYHNTNIKKIKDESYGIKELLLYRCTDSEGNIVTLKKL